MTPQVGYDRWQPTYEDEESLDLMDLALFARLDVSWGDHQTAADLGCGTGRIGAWLSDQGVHHVDGVDTSPEMLAAAMRKGSYRSLRLADVRSTGLPGSSYSLVVSSLVDEHIQDLDDLYAEAARLLDNRGQFLLAGYHPFFMMAAGMPTHFDDTDGTPTAIETHLHLFSDHARAAAKGGFIASGLFERVIDIEWLSVKPKWEPFLGWPISFAWLWTFDGDGTAPKERSERSKAEG